MVRVRLHGEPTQVQRLTEQLQAVLDVRRYLDVEPALSPAAGAGEEGTIRPQSVT